MITGKKHQTIIFVFGFKQFTNDLHENNESFKEGDLVLLEEIIRKY